MEEDKKLKLPIAIIAGIVSVILASMAAGAWLALRSNQETPPVTKKPEKEKITSENSPNPSETVTPIPTPSTTIKPVPTPTESSPPKEIDIKPETETPKPQPTSPVKEEHQVKIYLLKDTGKNIEVSPSEITVQSEKEPAKILKATLEDLLTKSNEGDLFSTIPKGTKLLGVKLKKDGVHVNLSQDFTKGGGTTSMSGRLAQILYTATTLNEKDQVWISVEGKKLEVLGGEGLILDQPLTRQKFGYNFDL